MNKPFIHVRERGLSRLPAYDYHTVGAYWVTLDVHDHECILSTIQETGIILKPAGRIVQNHIKALPSRVPVELDTFVIMPNHVHMILLLLPKSDHPLEVKCAKSLPRIIQSFRVWTAAEINRHRKTPGKTVWQRNYYERVIRDTRELEKFRAYALSNPDRWLAKLNSG